MTASQYTLPVTLTRRRARGREDFLVSASNATALAMIDGWRDWPGGQLALTGPPGVGKTHLAHVWMTAAGAERVTAASLRAADAPVLLAAGGVAVEGCDAGLDDGAEAALFHILNLARAEARPVLLTGRAAPGRWPVRLPDLASRLAALPVAEIGAPDDALLSALLLKHFADRHLKVSEEVIRFLAPRIERSAAAAARMAAELDAAALAAGRRLTVPFVKTVTGL